MKRSELIALLVDEILTRKHASTPLRVAIDGRCGSGKTMLADEIASAMIGTGIEILRTSVDEFHHPAEHRYRQGEYSARGYFEDAFNYSAVIERVEGPLADVVLIFDGVFVLRQVLDPCWDLKILIDVDAETAIARAVERDGLVLREKIERKNRIRYEPAWQIYAEDEQPEHKADFIVGNRNVANPTLLLVEKKNGSRRSRFFTD